MPIDKSKAGIKALQHVVVLMMENRSFDHMLGGLKARNPKIDGLTGNESNPDTQGRQVKVQPLAEYQGQLDPDPDHHFPGVNLQLFEGTTGPPTRASMQGFIKSYFEQRRDIYLFDGRQAGARPRVIAASGPPSSRGCPATPGAFRPCSAWRTSPTTWSSRG